MNTKAAQKQANQAINAAIETLLAELNSIPGQQHGEGISVWYSGNDGYWKASRL